VGVVGMRRSGWFGHWRSLWPCRVLVCRMSPGVVKNEKKIDLRGVKGGVRV
jgi:hypothetical protein